MTKGSAIFLSFILLAFIRCEFIPTDEANLAVFNVIKQAYNGDNFALIYQQLDDEIQKALTLKQFEEILVAKKSKTGPIEYWSQSSPAPQHPIFILGFKKNLAVGSIEWEYQETKFKVFLLNEFVQPTFVEFLKQNPSRTSITVKTDDVEILNYQGNRQQDLMSVFKITVAIEFSRQSASGIIDPEKWISLDEVNKYYLKDVDTSHALFLDLWDKMGKIQDGKIQLIEIANAMIALSSNCNTEYLQTLLTMDSIEQTISSLQLEQTQSFYLSSFFLVFLNYDNKEREEYIKQISSFTPEYVLEETNRIHQILEQGGQQAQDLLDRGKEVLDGEILGIQAQYFTKASTSAYVNLLDKLNKQETFNTKFYDIFYPLIGYASLKNQILAKTYKHVGVRNFVILRLKVALQLIQKIQSVFQAQLNFKKCIFHFLIHIKFNSFSVYRLIKFIPKLNKIKQTKDCHSYCSKTAYALFTQDLDYETEYDPLIKQFNIFTALLSLNGYYLQAVSKALTSISQDQNIFDQ